MRHSHARAHRAASVGLAAGPERAEAGNCPHVGLDSGATLWGLGSWVSWEEMNSSHAPDKFSPVAAVLPLPKGHRGSLSPASSTFLMYHSHQSTAGFVPQCCSDSTRLSLWGLDLAIHHQCDSFAQPQLSPAAAPARSPNLELSLQAQGECAKCTPAGSTTATAHSPGGV